jgi:hypothetical protein
VHEMPVLYTSGGSAVDCARSVATMARAMPKQSALRFKTRLS